MRTAFLGLGRMGRPMARRLLASGHEVRVWNRTAERAEGFPSAAPSPTDCVLGAELVITMLADPAALRDVVFASGLHRALRPDAVLVDMSTVGPEVARRLHDAVERATLDAPVGGGVAQAETGELTVLVGGDAALLGRVRPVLEVFGDVVHCGGPGAGQAMKLAFNALLAVTMAGVGEAVGLAERFGLDTPTVLSVLESGGAGPMVRKKGGRIASRDYEASFALALMVKDVRLALDAARAAGKRVPFTELAARHLEAALDGGRGAEDYSVVAELFRD